MEKFAVDLDKVLDDFEFNEDCAEQIASINAPSNNAATSTSKCNLDASKNYNYLTSKEHQTSNTDCRSPMQDRLQIYANPNYLKNQPSQDSTDCINHFYLQDYTGDNKLTQKQAVPPYNSEPVSMTIHNDISHKFLQKQQNGSSSPKIDNRYDKKLNQPSIKPSVSNVFNSLNEYINAPTGGGLDYVHTVSDDEDLTSDTRVSNVQSVKCISASRASTEQLLIKDMHDKSSINLSESDVSTMMHIVKESTSEDYKDFKLCETLETVSKPVTDHSQDEHSTLDVATVPSSAKTDSQGKFPSTNLTVPSTSADANVVSETKTLEPSVLTLETPSVVNDTENVEKDIDECDTEQLNTSDINVESRDPTDENVVVEELSSNTLATTSISCTVEEEEVTESDSKEVETSAAAQKKFEFSKFDDLSEEELTKYLAELEAEEEKLNIPDVKTVSQPIEIKEDVLIRAESSSQDDDENEAPSFENATIAELPESMQEDIPDKTKVFPADYSSVDKDETVNRNIEDEQEAEVVSNDSKGFASLEQENIEKLEESSEFKKTEPLVTNETSALSQERCAVQESDISNEKDIQASQTHLRSIEQGMVADVKSSMQLEEKPRQEAIDCSTSSDVRMQATKDSTNFSDSTEHERKESSLESSMSKQSETIEKPSRPQTLDIVVPETTNEPRAIGSSCVSPPVQAQLDIEPPKDDCQGSSPDALDSSLESNSVLGKQPPIWVPDCVAASCMLCDVKFTVLKRRHHCRACGKVFCSKCCNLKYKLVYEGNAESRVCVLCYQILTKAESEQGMSDWSSGYSTYTNNNEVNSPQGRQPNPNNPMEYCSTIPPLQQLAGGLPPPPTVMVPVGVLKRVGGTKHRSEGSKSVMFSDGIRPGCDLTELDMTWDDLQPVYRKSSSKKVSSSSSASSSMSSTTPKRSNLPRIDPVTECYVPQDPNSLPATVTIHKGQVSYHAAADEETLYRTLQNDCQPPVMFAINRNLYAYVKITNLNCCVNKICWNVTSRGLACVGQDEVILLIETLPDETRIPKDLLIFINQLYVEAMKGNTVSELGFAVYHGGNLLTSREHAGFLFIRQTLQCLQKIVLPPAPFLVGLLIHRWETPWAKVFPLRLLLRLGAEYRYYPCPLVSVRFRDALYFEIGHTVMKVLADFRNYSYTLPAVRGLTIHLRNRMTDVMFPRNRYDQVIKGLNNSNDHVLAYASNFSIAADSHLVCIQTNTGDESSYQTQAINIQNKPRTVTGASFIVINGALKSSMGLSAKSSIVEDGLMVEIMPEKMEALKAALKNMQDFSIGCGRQGASEPDETVNIKWVDNDVQFNIGVKSPIDGQLMDGIPSIRVHNGTDYKGTSRFIRWTEVFIIKSDDHPNGVHDPVDINKLSGNIAKATCTALVKLLDLLATAGLTKLAVRTTIHPDNVGYEAGSEGTKLPPIYMNSLDNELIQVLHKAAQSSQDTHTVLELIFYVLDD